MQSSQRSTIDATRPSSSLVFTSVPQIFVGEVHVGGYDDMIALHRAGKLDALLAGETA